MRYAGHEPAPGGSLTGRGSRSPWGHADGPGRMAPRQGPRRARQSHAGAPASPSARVEPGREHLAVLARQLVVEPRVRLLPRHRRPLLLRVEPPHRPALDHHVHRPPRLGQCIQCMMISAGWYEMCLERFRRTRMVVLNRGATAYQAQAMEDNHIGAVLVSEPPRVVGIITDRDLALAVLGGGLDAKTTPLGEVMSEKVITCEVSANLDEVVRLMRDNGIRRSPLVEGGRPVGLVTFDDLVVDGSVSLEALRSIVTAQLEV